MRSSTASEDGPSAAPLPSRLTSNSPAISARSSSGSFRASSIILRAAPLTTITLRSEGGPRNSHMDVPPHPKIESFPTQVPKTADVSPVEGTIACSNYLVLFASPRNRTQEADGSIPFISTIFLLFFVTQGSAVMKSGESLPRLGVRARLFRGERERLLVPASTPKTLR